MSDHVEEIEVGTMEETRTVPKLLRIEIRRDRQLDPRCDVSQKIRLYKADVSLGRRQLFVLSIWADDVQAVRRAVNVLLRHLLAPNHGFKPIL